MRGGVLARVEGFGNLAGRCIGAGDQGIGQRRFAHPGLADENAGVAGEIGPQGVGIVMCAQPQHRVAERLVGGEGGRGVRHALGEVALVEHDQRFHVLAFGSDDAARDQLVGKRWLGGDDDDDLRDVGGDQLLLEFVGAVEQGIARRDRIDHPNGIAAAQHADAITAGQIAFLAAREAAQRFAH